MKSYTITVNGQVYDVTVEEKKADGQAAAAPKAPTPKAPAPKAAAARPAGNEGAIKVNSPMPGKILEVKAAVGQSVKRGEVLMILEAMKMENEIVAPEDGVIADIKVAAGSAVEAGDILASLN